MKVAIVYSGKGGVGKTTTTANVARVLAREGKKVFVLDMDINTPSMNTEFKGDHPEENLWVYSTGNMYDKFIYLQDSMINRFLRGALGKMRKLQPDVVLIDTPPSMTQAHLSLLENLKVSMIIFVSQPTALSREDVLRTMDFFRSRGTDKAVLVENMCTGEENFNYGVPIVTRIPFSDKFNTTDFAEKYKDEYLLIGKTILDSDAVLQKEYIPGTRYDETFDIVDSALRITSRGRSQGYDIKIRRDGEDTVKEMHLPRLKFLSVRTWKVIRDYIINHEEYHRGDMRIFNCDYERVRRIVEPFYTSEQNYFMVTNAPVCQIRLIPGEIGQATLDTEGKYHYGIPKLKYLTSKGEICLFPDEVRPCTDEEIQEHIQQEGYIMLMDGRYMPPKSLVEECYNAFGSRLGLDSRWEATYDTWVNSK